MIKMMRPGNRWKGPSWTEQFALPRTRLGLTLVGLAIVFFGVNFCEKIVTSIDADQQVASLQQQISAINRQNSQLQKQIQYYKTDAYVIKMARENYLYKQSGDTIFRVANSPDGASLSAPGNSPVPVPTPTPPVQPWWQGLLNLFGQ